MGMNSTLHFLFIIFTVVTHFFISLNILIELKRSLYCVLSLFTLFKKSCHNGSEQLKSDLTFIGPCIIIYFYSKTNQMHQCLKFILYCRLLASKQLAVSV